MSKAAKRRRFLRWRKYRRQCVESTGQYVPLTMAMGDAWAKAVYRIREGKFYAMPHWYMRDMPRGNWSHGK